MSRQGIVRIAGRIATLISLGGQSLPGWPGPGVRLVTAPRNRTTRSRFNRSARARLSRPRRCDQSTTNRSKDRGCLSCDAAPADAHPVSASPSVRRIYRRLEGVGLEGPADRTGNIVHGLMPIFPPVRQPRHALAHIMTEWVMDGLTHNTSNHEPDPSWLYGGWLNSKPIG